VLILLLEGDPSVDMLVIEALETCRDALVVDAPNSADPLSEESIRDVPTTGPSETGTPFTLGICSSKLLLTCSIPLSGPVLDEVLGRGIGGLWIAGG
jgi:hypothetical protein